MRLFYANKGILCCKQIHTKQRLKHLTTLVKSTLFWCSGSWHLTVHQQGRLRTTHNQMIRITFDLKKARGRIWVSRCTGSTKRSRSSGTMHRCLLVIHILRNRFLWAGHVGGLGKQHKTRLTYKVLQQRILGSNQGHPWFFDDL